METFLALLVVAAFLLGPGLLRALFRSPEEREARRFARELERDLVDTYQSLRGSRGGELTPLEWTPEARAIKEWKPGRFEFGALPSAEAWGSGVPRGIAAGLEAAAGQVIDGPVGQYLTGLGVARDQVRLELLFLLSAVADLVAHEHLGATEQRFALSNALVDALHERLVEADSTISDAYLAGYEQGMTPYVSAIAESGDYGNGALVLARGVPRLHELAATAVYFAVSALVVKFRIALCDHYDLLGATAAERRESED